MHVECTKASDTQQWCRQHRAVVERKNEVGLQVRDPPLQLRRVGMGGSYGRDAILRGGCCHTSEPLSLIRIVGYGHDQRDLHATRNERLEAANADVVITEHHCSSSGHPPAPEVLSAVRGAGTS